MLFALLTLACALAVSAIAAYYSVIGLIAIFAAAPIPIAIMGASLEASKLVVASWLYKNWTVAPKLLKYYFTTAVAVLMIITSLGIFGFLSKAHLDQAATTGDTTAKLEIIDEKIRVAKENVAVERKNLKQLDDSVDQIMARSTTEEGARRASAVRVSQKSERNRIANEIEAQQKIIAKLNEDRQPLAIEVRKIEAEVGPLKYIAELIYGKDDAANHFDAAVRWVIILLIIVFDPLAVLLVIAANYSLSQERKPKPVIKTKVETDNLRGEFKSKKKKVDLTSVDPIPMNKDEIVSATELYRRDHDSM
jgi:hypothetical protein